MRALECIRLFTRLVTRHTKQESLLGNLKEFSTLSLTFNPRANHHATPKYKCSEDCFPLHFVGVDFRFHIWVFPKKKWCPQIIHLFIGFSMINYFHHPFWGCVKSPYFWFNTHLFTWCFFGTWLLFFSAKSTPPPSKGTWHLYIDINVGPRSPHLEDGLPGPVSG